MRSEYEIYMDFNKAIGQADRLERIAYQMDSLANERLGGTLRTIRQNWTGENADSYTGKGDEVQRRISKTASDLLKVAGAIRKIAIRTRDAELAAIQIATT